VNATLDTLWKTYETTSDLIKFADAKAGAVLAANGIIIGSLVANLQSSIVALHNHLALLILLLLIVAATTFSTYFSIVCLSPNTKFVASDSLIFFGSVAQFQTRNLYEEAARVAFADDTALLTQLTQEVWATARVATSKYRAVAWAIRGLGVSVFLGIVVVAVALLG